MTTVSVTMVNTTNEDLILDTSDYPPEIPRRIAAHATGRFGMDGHGVAYLVGGDPDRAVYLQENGSVWAPPTCVIRSATVGEAVAVQVSPAPWLHDHSAA
ncbi:hypothetical protein [Rhodococcus sp. Q]|uniref:hypothetical protein n=1 Tax=Rhodococcus sp. Q TaxID=2502252 RepID=UPI0010F8EC87|nr:hypothetical protein [Rhodococcus sp. Q]